MKFNEVTIHTTTAGSEVVSGVLFNEGITCFSVDDPRDLAELLENKYVPFDYVEDGLLREDGDVLVRVYLAENEQGALQLEGILAGIEKLKAMNEEWLGTLETELAVTDEKDWENNWKQYFHPLQIGEKFLVVPSWEKAEEEGRTVIEIDPASSFGTGRHETTALCLEAVETLSPEGKNILDMGCGSGILGIGAALLGAEHIDAVDIDMVATRIAEENAVKNGLPEGKMDVFCGNVLTDKDFWDRFAKEEYDIILANIVADIISDMLPLFDSCLKADGRMVCSGIISPRKEFVLDALKNNGFEVVDLKEKNDWVAIICKKK
ncbi:MAG: 50S ribosomal protein L11 methyltransferase [Clostridia bacterium]|nr:50S ribosomal protein L11 methyltransferase [Clostridia bacterium]MBR6754718.1 50S ribosomal protein L11 methyltransferase [Clostridia bacterium]